MFKNISPSQLRDVNYTPPTPQAILLGIQHVLTMFIANVTPAIIIAGAAGFGYNSVDESDMLYLIQLAMFFAGITTILQTIGIGKIGSRLPIMQGTSFAYVPVMIPALIVAGGVGGLPALTTAVIICGIFHFCLGFFIKPLRFIFPPLVTGLIILMIGMALIEVGITYAAGGYGVIETSAFGSSLNWSLAIFVCVVILAVKFFVPTFYSLFAIFVGIVAGYIVALFLGKVDFSAVGQASFFAFPQPLKYGLVFDWPLIIAMSLVSIISLIETIGDTVAVANAGAGRDATDDEIQGATFADGLGTALAGLFGGLPNTSYSENVGVVSITGVMSRVVVAIAGGILLVCGLFPVIAAFIRTIPIEVLGGAVMIMFGMIAAAGMSILAKVQWGRRNMFIFATSLSLALGLQLVPEATQHLSANMQVFFQSGLMPAAFAAIILNLVLPNLEGEQS